MHMKSLVRTITAAAIVGLIMGAVLFHSLLPVRVDVSFVQSSITKK